MIERAPQPPYDRGRCRRTAGCIAPSPAEARTNGALSYLIEVPKAPVYRAGR